MERCRKTDECNDLSGLDAGNLTSVTSCSGLDAGKLTRQRTCESYSLVNSQGTPLARKVGPMYRANSAPENRVEPTEQLRQPHVNSLNNHKPGKTAASFEKRAMEKGTPKSSVPFLVSFFEVGPPKTLNPPQKKGYQLARRPSRSSFREKEEEEKQKSRSSFREQKKRSTNTKHQDRPVRVFENKQKKNNNKKQKTTGKKREQKQNNTNSTNAPLRAWPPAPPDRAAPASRKPRPSRLRAEARASRGPRAPEGTF